MKYSVSVSRNSYFVYRLMQSLESIAFYASLKTKGTLGILVWENEWKRAKQKKHTQVDNLFGIQLFSG